MNTLQHGEFDILHFSTHAKFTKDSPLLSVMQLDKKNIIRPENISGKYTAFGNSAPLVILNTCQSGALGYSLSEIQGWAKKFLAAGASNFIGTLWSVSDKTALMFTQELYTQMSQGIPIGEAVCKARKKGRVIGDPSWLSYQLYGLSAVPITITKPNR
jgi:CHAT domain-containing protein